MNSKSIPEPSGQAPCNPSDCLTEQQRAFAEVVGHALAEAWRRRWEKVKDKPSGSSQQDTRPSTWPH